MKIGKKIVRNNLGATAVEYALIAGLIAAVVIGTVTTLGNKSNNKLVTVSNGL